MSENELLKHWSATKDKYYLSLLLERLYTLGEAKLSDKISKDVLHNAIIKIHVRLEKDTNIKEIKSFFLKTLYNGLMDYYKAESNDTLIPIDKALSAPDGSSNSIESVDLVRLQKLEDLIRKKQLRNSRINFLKALLLDKENDLSRQIKFFHRTELKRTISLVDLSEVGHYFTYTHRVISENEDQEQAQQVQQLYEQGKEYKRAAIAFANNKFPKSYSETERNLLVLFNFTIALNLYKQACEISPGYFKARFNIGFCLYKLDKFTEAVKEFKAAVFYLNKQTTQSNFDLKMGSALRNMGTIYLLHLGQYHKALSAFESALKFTPKDEKIRLGLIFSACKLNDEGVVKEHLSAFNSKSEISKYISDWTDSDEKIKHLAISLYKESISIRPYIPIEKII
jgi:tetratricopeptide (TPR) repeat protein